MNQMHRSGCPRNQKLASRQRHSLRLPTFVDRQHQRPVLVAGATEAAAPSTLPEACAKLTQLLAQEGDEAEIEAVKLVQQLQASGQLRAFGKGRQLPKRVYTIDELRLNQVEPKLLLSPQDTTILGIRNTLQGAAGVGLAAMVFVGHAELQQVLFVILLAVFLLTADQVGNRGGAESLLLDTMARILRPDYSKRVALHEAGHFLVAYLLGILPRAYTLSSLDAFVQYRALNVQAGCQFCDSDFRQEVASGKLSSTTLSNVSCVALAGVVTEYLRFERAEGGLGDIAQLDMLLRSLQFSQMKTDAEVRWAVLNVAQLLRRHNVLLDELAAALSAGKSVGDCVLLLEEKLADCDDV